MENFQEIIDKLIIDMIKAGHKAETIMWNVSTTVTKKCDIFYRLDHPLIHKRYESPSDESTGDSEKLGLNDNIVTIDELDQQLEDYMDHDRYCICHQTNDCPICYDGNAEYILECCNKSYHQKCLRKWYGNKHNTCPTCRHELIVSDDIEVMAKPKPKTKKNTGSYRIIKGISYSNTTNNRSQYNRVTPPNYFNRPRLPPSVNNNNNNNNNNTTNTTNRPQLPPPVSDSNYINVIPIPEHTNLFIEINYKFILRQNNDGSIVALFVSINSTYDPDNLRHLTDEEKIIAQSLGIDVVDDTVSVHNNNNNNNNNRGTSHDSHDPFNQRRVL